MVPDSLLPFSASPGLSLIPYESVAGIVEIKRTLTTNSIIEACDHLQRCEFIFSAGKHLDSIAIGGLGSPDIIGYRWNPFLSILSVCSELNADNEIKVMEKLDSLKNSQISFIASFEILPLWYSVIEQFEWILHECKCGN